MVMYIMRGIFSAPASLVVYDSAMCVFGVWFCVSAASVMPNLIGWIWCSHVAWPRSTPILISRHRNGFNRGYCLVVIERPSEGDWMVMLQMQHFCSLRGMRMKSQEPELKFGVGHQNDLEHIYECFNACWYVLDVLHVLNL
jgi:hypothetical protein